MHQRFSSQVEVVLWGRNRYHVIRVPEALSDAARRQGTRRVAGTIEGVAVNLALNRAPVIEGSFLWAGQTLLRSLEVEPGEYVNCVLQPVDPDAVDLPDDIRQALADAGAVDRWEALPAPARRRHLHAVNSAKRADTRVRRIADLVRAIHRPSP